MIPSTKSIISKTILFANVLPDDQPKVLKYSSGWSKDRCFSNGIDCTANEDKGYNDKAANAFETMKPFTFSLMDMVTSGKSKTSCK